jgi:hypothetical protein
MRGAARARQEIAAIGGAHRHAQRFLRLRRFRHRQEVRRPHEGELRYPAAIGASPSQRQRLVQMQSRTPPSPTRISASAGMLGTLSTAPRHPVTPRAMAATASMPQLIGASANASAPNGISRQAMSAQGMIQKPVIGTASASEID